MLFGKKHDKRFLELFKEHIAISVQCAHALALLLKQPNDVLVQKIIDFEHRGDDITRETHELLDSVFITRIDKDDIAKTITTLDNITDSMKGVARQMQAYGITETRDEAKKFAGAIVSMVQEVSNLVDQIDSWNPKTTNALVVQIKQHEELADDERWIATRKLWQEENDMKKLIAWKEIFRELERITDHCEDVADVISSIARKLAR